jgi:sugar phosphate isomerase/epimerase
MYYTGFADEAGDSIDVQIRATLELGWSNIEARSVDGANLTDVTDETFEQVCEKLAAAGVRINCFASAIANWSRDPRSEEDFQYSVETLRRAIPRMRHLGTPMIRGMSFSIEPHLAVVYHDSSAQSKDEVRHNNYVDYGRHFMRLVDVLTENRRQAG